MVTTSNISHFAHPVAERSRLLADGYRPSSDARLSDLPERRFIGREGGSCIIALLRWWE